MSSFMNNSAFCDKQEAVSKCDQFALKKVRLENEKEGFPITAVREILEQDPFEGASSEVKRQCNAMLLSGCF